MSKSRQEKTKTPAQSAAPPTVNNDIVPGRFTENDWHHMVEQEDGEDFVVEIVGEIVEATMSILHDKYIEKQTLPYTVQETKNLLLQIIEWQFLAGDLGEENPAVDSTWLEEDEPDAPITDSWAQGSVPVLPVVSTSVSSASSIRSEQESEASSVMDQRPNAPEPPFEAQENAATPESISSPMLLPSNNVSQKSERAPKPSPPEKVPNLKQKRRTPFKRHKGKLPSFSGVDLTPLTDDYVTEKTQAQVRGMQPAFVLDQNGLAILSSSTSILKAQQGRPPGTKDVSYDERGNVVAVMRIDPDKLPVHRIRTKFAVVNMTSDTSQMQSKARQRRLASLTQKKNTKKEKAVSKSNREKNTFDLTSFTQPRDSSGERTPLPPPLVDTMDINAGVVIREGDIVRRGPIQVPRQLEKTPSATMLQPLNRMARSGLALVDIVSRTSPIIKPLHATEPVPPILPTSPTKS